MCSPQHSKLSNRIFELLGILQYCHSNFVRQQNLAKTVSTSVVIIPCLKCYVASSPKKRIHVSSCAVFSHVYDNTTYFLGEKLG